MTLVFAWTAHGGDDSRDDQSAERPARDQLRLERGPVCAPSPDDVALAERLRAGDPAALDAIVARSYGPLLTYVTNAFGSEDIASDLLQEVFSQIWHRRETFPIDRAIMPYVVGIARHRVLDYLRTRKRTERKLSDYAQWYAATQPSGTDPLTSTEQEEFVHAAQAAIEQLPARAQEIWRLSREQGLSFPEIASVLGISVNTVKTQMTRATSALRVALLPFLSVFLTVYR